jgi:putative ABC transport system permease protein
VIGVVRDAHLFRVVEEVPPQYYLSLAQDGFTPAPAVLLARTAGDAAAYAPRVARALRGLAPRQPFLDARPLDAALDPEARPWRLGATVFTIYGAFALFLAALGLYSAVAYGVALRTREIGVRIAVGAGARHVVALVLRDGLAVGALGLALGIPGALLLGARLSPLLLRVGPRDVAALLGAAALLALTVLLASFLPARRAAGVDPAAVLRSE